MGFLNPKFLKIPQSSFNYKAIQNNLSNSTVNIDRLNNSINCINRKRFGAFLAGLKNA